MAETQNTTASSVPGMKGMKLMFIVFALTIVAALLWDRVPIIKQSVNFVADPSIGSLLNWNVTYGMLIVVAIMTLITVIIQKFFTDQKLLKEIRKEQKVLQEEMKKVKDHPEKLMELQKKQFEVIPKTMEITMRPTLYTIIPLVLFFRWFNDYFVANPHTFFGFMSWFWFYLIVTIVMSMILRKVLDVA